MSSTLKWPVGLKLIWLEQQNIITSLYFSKKSKTSTPREYKRQIKYLGLEIYNSRIQILPAKNDVILLKNSAFGDIQVLIELIFGLFLIRYIHIKRIFKILSRFFLLLCSFWVISKYLAPRVIVQAHLKRMFDF